jgi:UDP-2,3-diacylglucosamine pyrophosphatase LpxH
LSRGFLLSKKDRRADMHSRLLASLLSVAKVNLVACLRDDRIGFPSNKDLRIFIPDIHLISEKRRKQGNFTFATNFPDLLTAVADALTELRAKKADDETIAVYQLGDFLDLWRENPGLDDKLEVASQIKDDHEDLVSALLDRRLKARFLLGNHDFDLYRWPDYSAWERRYYLPDASAQAPSLILLHGDIFDWVELMPDKVQDVFVYLFAPHLSPTDYSLGQMKALIKQSHGRRNYRTYIRAPKPVTVGHIGDDMGNIPDIWNIQKEGSSSPENLKFLKSAYECCQKANKDYGMNLRAAVIGHTHHARIAVHETDKGDLFTLIDCGAWIENCIADGESSSAPNAQIGALSANEARIYQLAKKE